MVLRAPISLKFLDCVVPVPITHLLHVIFTNMPDEIVCSGVSHICISDHGLGYVFRILSTGVSDTRGGRTTVT